MKQRPSLIVLIGLVAVLLITLSSEFRVTLTIASAPSPRGTTLLAWFRDAKTLSARALVPLPPAVPAPAVPEAFAVCGRPVAFEPASWSRQRRWHGACPPFDPARPTLVLGHMHLYGRTGNQLRTFLRAVQYARDKGLQLAVMREKSWAPRVLLQFFLADGAKGDGAWKGLLEERLCVKTLSGRNSPKAGPTVVIKSNKYLFKYASKAPYEDQVAGMLHVLRTLYQHYNTGVGHSYMSKSKTKTVRDMCTGIDALFAPPPWAGATGGGAGDPRSAAVYSVVHLRAFEGHGKVLMQPDYVRAVLAPLGLLAHPVVVITDQQKGSEAALAALLQDPDLGPRIRVVPEAARWVGGDLTLGVAATAFLGNPYSTMSTFIARSRVALGLGHSYLYRAKDKATGAWTAACGDVCLFRCASVQGKCKPFAFRGTTQGGDLPTLFAVVEAEAALQVEAEAALNDGAEEMAAVV